MTRTRVCAGTRRRCGAAGSTWMSVRRCPGDSTRDPGSDSRCRHAAAASRRLDDGRRVQLQTRSTQVYSAAGPDRLRNRSAVYINMLAVSGGTGGGRTGPVRLGSGTGVKINSRERRAERTLIWVFLAFVVLWLPFFCANFDCKPSRVTCSWQVCANMTSSTKPKVDYACRNAAIAEWSHGHE